MLMALIGLHTAAKGVYDAIVWRPFVQVVLAAIIQ